MSKSNLAEKVPCITDVVLQNLRRRRKPVTTAEVSTSTGYTHDQVSAALIHLTKYRVCKRTFDRNGVAFYTLTGKDTRIRTVKFRTPEKGPRNRSATILHLVHSTPHPRADTLAARIAQLETIVEQLQRQLSPHKEG